VDPGDDRHPSEPERAARAIVLGLLLGGLLALVGRGRRQSEGSP
jgi:MYXO-CTERM domain-containing protein